MGLYIQRTDVEQRLKGKVRFTADPSSDDEFSYALLDRLINEAEAQVEMDLSPRYLAPFQSVHTGTFAGLPERPTKEYIRTCCELQAVIRVLETDFGMGAVNSKDYLKNLDSRYKSMVDRTIKRLIKDQRQWCFPPLPGLKLNYFNDLADDGYEGMVWNTSDGRPYASNQINDPSQTYYSIRHEDVFDL